ncbi:MAG: transglutaminase domain-containing protein [Candidatus Thorarchaeota archaeon]|nr:transglutaminase domain-containing protein [Candidatus Thorarchaeota archaeon]
MNLDDYLKPTEYCDSDHRKIIAKAKELTQNIESPKMKALSIFHYVRDEIKFGMYNFVKASETLNKGVGDCGNKANLQIALLRAVNIPARYRIISLRKECIKGVVSDMFYNASPEVIPNHPVCECYLSEKWISSDTSFDRDLLEAAYKKGIFNKEEIPTIDWDGESNLNTLHYWMVEDKGTLHSLDDLVREAEKEFEELPIDKDQLEMVIRQSNEHTNSLRE